MGVNETRYKLFSKKIDNEEKAVDMSALPPCESVLRKSKFLSGNLEESNHQSFSIS